MTIKAPLASKMLTRIPSQLAGNTPPSTQTHKAYETVANAIEARTCTSKRIGEIQTQR